MSFTRDGPSRIERAPMTDGVEASVLSHEASAPTHVTRHALRAAERWLQREGLKLVGYLALAYLVMKLIPGLRQALRELERLSWGWLLAVVGVESLSQNRVLATLHTHVRSVN